MDKKKTITHKVNMIDAAMVVLTAAAASSLVNGVGVNRAPSIPEDMPRSVPDTAAASPLVNGIGFDRARRVEEGIPISLPALVSPGKTVTMFRSGVDTIQRTPSGENISGALDHNGTNYRTRDPHISLEYDGMTKRVLIFSPVRDNQTTKHNAESVSTRRYIGANSVSAAKKLSETNISRDELRAAVAKLGTKSCLLSTDKVQLTKKSGSVTRSSARKIMGCSARQEFEKLIELVNLSPNLSKEERDSVTSYLKLYVEKLQPEWTHMIARSHASSPEQSEVHSNLYAGTDRLNTEFIPTEQLASSFNNAQNSVSVKTQYSTICGTKVLNEVTHQVNILHNDFLLVVKKYMQNFSMPDIQDLVSKNDPVILHELVNNILEGKSENRFPVDKVTNQLDFGSDSEDGEESEYSEESVKRAKRARRD